MTDFHAVPATGDGIVVMANSQRSWPLIAHVLSDWSEWNGFSPVGFAIIARAACETPFQRANAASRGSNGARKRRGQRVLGHSTRTGQCASLDEVGEE